MTTLRSRLQSALPEAMKSKDRAAVAALRSALAAIENAAAVAPVDAPTSLPVAGLGATEVPRREQDDAEIERIVRTEIDDRLAAAAGYDTLGRADQAARLRAEAHALRVRLG